MELHKKQVSKNMSDSDIETAIKNKPNSSLDKQNKFPDFITSVSKKSNSHVDTNYNAPNFITPIQKISPGVVTVHVLGKPKKNSFLQRNNDSLQDLFRHFFQGSSSKHINLKSTSNYSKAIPVALGTGFILSKDGYILTNAHVVRNADEIEVSLYNRNEYKAKIIGQDPETDIALLKIEADNLQPLILGDSDELQVGQWLFAMGSPLGLKYTASHGVVSYLNRQLTDNLLPFIQTDISINPGNSGGPLLNLKGEVVGINSQICLLQNSTTGISFSIPINEIRYVIDQLKQHGKVQRGWLGISFQDLTPSLANSFGLKSPIGALVSNIMPDSPAEKAGFKSGDIILKFNNKNIDFHYNLNSTITKIPANTTVKAHVWRNEKKIILTPTIVAYDDKNQTNSIEQIEKSKLGLKVRTLDDQDRQSKALKNQIKGVVITEINEGVCLDSGLKVGSIILELYNMKINNLDDYNQAVKKIIEASNKQQENQVLHIHMKVLQDRNPLYLPITY